MTDVWFGPGLTRDDYHGFLNALALDPRNGAPLLAVATGNEAARLVMASCAFFDLFGVRGSEELSRRLLDGRDPGSKRLGDLFRSLPPGCAPRLERLRFMLGHASEVITFLCRRTKTASGEPVFLAAALGIRPGLMTSPPVSLPLIAEGSTASAETPRHERTFQSDADEPAADQPTTLSEIQAALASRWPAVRRVRFTWQTDAAGVCRQLSPPLEAAVGRPNGDLVGQNLLDLAPRLDPSGRLAAALARRDTWSGIDVDWPITDAPGAVAIALGAIAAVDRDRAFAGFKGYGVIHLDRVAARQPVRLVPGADSPQGIGNVVPFPGPARPFTAEDQLTFVALGAELRDRVGLGEAPIGPERGPSPEAASESPVEEQHAREDVLLPHPAASPGEELAPPRAADPPMGARHEARDNGLAVLDRLPLGLLVSRDNVPIFANRHLLEMLGYPDEDALHEAGGVAHLFATAPGGMAGGEAISVRDRNGVAHATSARLHRIEWDGLPATLLTLQPAPEASAAQRLEMDQDAALEQLAREHAEERRRDQGELRRLRAILETATDGVAVIDEKGDVLSLNRSGEALFGRDRTTVIGRPFLDLFAQDNQSLAKEYLDGLVTDATRSLLNDGREISVKAPQGGTIPVFMTLGRLDRADQGLAAGEGTDARLCALFRDLTHWKKVEHELRTAKGEAEAASAAKTEFLAKVSHEVRTPLNAIIGFAEVILEERFGPIGNARYRDYLRDIHTSGAHVMSLINDLLDLSKIEAGRMELSPTVIDANKVIAECVGLMQPQASRERVIMRLSLAPSLPMIRADERSVRQIVLNLLSNAVKYNEPGGQVIVATAAPEDGKVIIRIRDTGPGMSESDIAAAMEPFRQVSTRPMTEGTGLGLPLTKALVEANEATFMIRSKLNQGTLIEVAFPPARVLTRQR